VPETHLSRVSIALLIHHQKPLSFLGLARGVIEAVFIFEHPCVIDGEWTVASFLDCHHGIFETERSITTLGFGNSACPVLTHGRTAIATAPTSDESRHRIGKGRMVMLRCFRVFLLSELHCSFENFIVFHLDLLSFSAFLT
jgi:hypothetical protein